MDLSEFGDLLATLGPDLAGWPAERAEAAIGLMAESPEAQDLFIAATADRFARDEAPDSATFAGRIAAALAAKPQD